MYEYKILIIDTNGNKYHFNAEGEPDQYQAEALAEEWVTQGEVNVEIDSITTLETNDPIGIIDTGN
jgi:hypothetical protein